MLLLGVSATIVNEYDGIESRSAVIDYNANLDELTRTPAKDEECLLFLGLTETKFDYCKIGKLESNYIVAIIGDSHAHVSFPGISEGLSKLGYITVLLANSSCPPFIGSPGGRNVKEKFSCSEKIDQIILQLSSVHQLEQILIFTRGPTYWTGNEPSSSKQLEAYLSIDSYFEGLQKTIDHFSNNSVDVIYVTENPELKYQARSCLPRPFSQSAQKCEQDLRRVLDRQKEYRERLYDLERVTVVDANRAFCKEIDQKCFVVNPQNQLLYADDDHISVIGSAWQYDKLLKAHFE